MRRAAWLVAAALTLAACGAPADDPGSGRSGFSVDQVDVNGRQVTCISWKSGYGGGLSCDWGR